DHPLIRAEGGATNWRPALGNEKLADYFTSKSKNAIFSPAAGLPLTFHTIFTICEPFTVTDTVCLEPGFTVTISGADSSAVVTLTISGAPPSTPSGVAAQKLKVCSDSVPLKTMEPPAELAASGTKARVEVPATVTSFHCAGLPS